jgi:hypothetical protein
MEYPNIKLIFFPFPITGSDSVSKDAKGKLLIGTSLVGEPNREPPACANLIPKKIHFCV